MTPASGELGSGLGIGLEGCPRSENQEEWPCCSADGAEIPELPSLAPSSFMELGTSTRPANVGVGVGVGWWERWVKVVKEYKSPGTKFWESHVEEGDYS